FILSGLWHGANWTYITWGALNAIYFLPLMLTNNNRNNIGIVAAGKSWPTIREFCMILFTFAITVFAWIFFRAESIGQALEIVFEIFSASLFTFPDFLGIQESITIVLLLFVFMTIEWKGREHQYAIEKLGVNKSRSRRWSYYIAILFSIYLFGNFASNIEFIYFQF
ncbi:MAG: MBOAT family protein, partial [Bacteroidales bacterium]|nr:MBOAT family protein [Bacteroidales bacterium]